MRMARTPANKENDNMASEAANLQATAPTGAPDADTPPANGAATPPADGEASADNPSLINFKIDGYDKDIQVDFDKCPPAVKKRLVYNATRGYVLNRVSTAVASAKKVNEAFERYDAAQANNPVQTIVPKPDGERKVVPYGDIIEGAIKALYSGEVGKRSGEGTTKDPLTDHITRTVVTEVFNKRKSNDPKYTYIQAKHSVGPDGLKWLHEQLDKAILESPTGTINEKLERDRIEAKYVTTAKIALGLVPADKKFEKAGVELF